MGKTNKAQRTKGNTRPSSSVQSALLLNASGKSFNGFVGFDASEKDPVYVPVTGQPDESGVDADFRMVMRKMIKRDALTRLKAVQEFGDFCSTKDVDTVKSVLPFWPRLFNKLALDCDRRIREATHRAHGKLVGKVHRDFAPYLRNVVGVWLLGQCDAYAPSASAALSAFAETFPPNKRSQALLFCKAEIISYFKDNLCDPSKFLNDVNVTSPEEAQNKQVFVLSSTLLALRLLFSEASAEDLKSFEGDFENIISEAKFWSYSKHKVALVRCSWYSLISSLCSLKMEAFLKVTVGKVSSILVGCLAEKDPVAVASSWETALHILCGLGGCEEIDFEHSVLPQLWAFLREGGRGNAHTLYPCLLPMLSKFPRHVVENISFQLKFLDILFKSSLFENVKSSRMECDAILQAFFECFQFFCFKLHSEKNVLMEKVLLQQILPVIESAIYEEEFSYFTTSKLYPLLGALLCRVVQAEDGLFSDSFSDTWSTFWTEMYLLTTKFHNRKKMIPPSRQLILLFQGLFDQSGPCTGREKPSVSFEEDVRNKAPSKSDGKKLFSPLLKTHTPSHGFLIKVLTFFYDKLCEEFNVHFLNMLKVLFSLTLNSELFRELLGERTALSFLEGGFLRWSIEAKENADCIVNAVFAACRCVSENERLAVLHACCEKKDIKFLGKVLECAKVHADSEVFHAWLEGVEWMDVTLGILEEMLSSLANPEADLGYLDDLECVLDLCLSDPTLRNFVASRKRDEQLLCCIRDRFQDMPIHFLLGGQSEAVLFSVCHLVCTLLQNLEVCWAESAADDVVTLLFYLNVDLGCKNKQENFLTVAQTLWDVAIEKRKVDVEENSFVLKTAHKLHFHMLHSSQEEYLEQQSIIIHRLLNSLRMDSEDPLDSSLSIANQVLQTILLSNDDWDVVRDGLFVSMLPSYVDNKIIHPPPREHSMTVAKYKFKRLITISKITASILIKESTRCRKRELLFPKYLLEQLSHLLWSVSFCTGNGVINEDIFAASKCEELCINCKSILTDLTSQQIQTLLRMVFSRALSLDSSWLLTFSMTLEMLQEFRRDSECPVLEMLAETQKLRTEQGRMAVQILLHHIPYEVKLTLLDELHSALENVASSSRDNLDLLAQLYCILKDPKLLTLDNVQNIAGDIFSALLFLDSKNSLPSYAFQCPSILRFIISQPGVLDEESWQCLERHFRDSLEKAMSAKYVEVGEMLHLYRAASLGLAMFEHAERFVEKSFVPFPRDFKPVIENSFYEKFVLLFLHLAENDFQYLAMFQPFDKIMATMLEALNFIPSERLLQSQEESNILEHLVSALSSDMPRIQFGAHVLLMKFLPLLPSTLTDITCDDEEGEKKFPAKLSPLLELAHFNDEVMANLLSEFRIGDCCIFVPRTDAFRFAVSYLLVWLEILEFTASSQEQLRPGYVDHLAEEKLLPVLFSNVFRLLPENPRTCLKGGEESLSSLFLQHSHQLDGSSSAKELHSLACLVFGTVLRKMPASIRTWFNNLDKLSADIVNGFVTKYISGILIAEEIRAVHSNDTKFEGMTVQAKLGSREVVASYSIDDCDLELCIRLPSNFPLGQVAAERRGRVAVAEQEWRHWLMQLATVLTYQNGSILDGLSLWKRNLDKKFEGVEECMICYYILHNATLRLPKLSCAACRKKFHSACLYKWFHTSNNSTCPLCRNEFSI